MHYTDILHTDATLDIDDTQANVSDCNARPRTHDQEASLAIFMNKPQDDTKPEPVHETYLPNPPCEPGSDVPPDWSGSWNPNQITPTLPCKSQASMKNGHT